MEEQKPVLVVTPHPDDAESGAGGSIARWTQEGRKVVLVVCTNGDKGTNDRSIKPEALAQIREEEQRKAAELLGIAGLVFLRFPDQRLEDTTGFRERLVRQIRLHKPSTVVTVDPYRRYIRHRDHFVCGRVTLDAVFPYARDHLSYHEHIREGLETHAVREILLWGSEEPDTFLEITDTFQTKLEALFCHVSQVGLECGERMERMRARSTKIGQQIGVPLAEAFKRIEITR